MACLPLLLSPHSINDYKNQIYFHDYSKLPFLDTGSLNLIPPDFFYTPSPGYHSVSDRVEHIFVADSPEPQALLRIYREGDVPVVDKLPDPEHRPVRVERSVL